MYDVQARMDVLVGRAMLCGIWPMYCTAVAQWQHVTRTTVPIALLQHRTARRVPSLATLSRAPRLTPPGPLLRLSSSAAAPVQASTDAPTSVAAAPTASSHTSRRTAAILSCLVDAHQQSSSARDGYQLDTLIQQYAYPPLQPCSPLSYRQRGWMLRTRQVNNERYYCLCSFQLGTTSDDTNRSSGLMTVTDFAWRSGVLIW